MANLDERPRTRGQSQDLPAGKVRGGEPLESGRQVPNSRAMDTTPCLFSGNSPAGPRPNCPETRRPRLLIPGSLPRTGEARKVQCTLAAHFCGRTLPAARHAGGQDSSEVASNLTSRRPSRVFCGQLPSLGYLQLSIRPGEGVSARAHTQTHTDTHRHTHKPPPPRPTSRAHAHHHQQNPLPSWKSGPGSGEGGGASAGSASWLRMPLGWGVGFRQQGQPLEQAIPATGCAPGKGRQCSRGTREHRIAQAPGQLRRGSPVCRLPAAHGWRAPARPLDSCPRAGAGASRQL